MDPLSVTASIMGILTFLGSCISLFKRFMAFLRKTPEIIHKVLRDLEDAKPILQRATRTIQGLPFSSIGRTNSALANCESIVLGISRLAEEADDRKNSLRGFPSSLKGRFMTQGANFDGAMANLECELQRLER